MRLLGIFGALTVFQVSCAPQVTNLGADTAAAPNRSDNGLAAYKQQFEISETDAQVLSKWRETLGSGDSWKYVVSESTKLEVAKRIYQQARDKGFFQEASPVSAPKFTWECIHAGVKKEYANDQSAEIKSRKLTHFFAHKPSEYGCFDDVFSAVVEMRGRSFVAYSPQSFVFNKVAADKTKSCTQHVHYTVNRVPHGMRCPGEDNYQIKIYDPSKCKAEDLKQKFSPQRGSTETDELQLGSCGGRVVIE